MDASEQIDRMIAELTDWRRETMTAVRAHIRAADPAVVEEWKYMGSPVYSCDGQIGVADAHKAHVKVTFTYGALIPDPHGLFNAGFNGNQRRAIDYREGDPVDGPALQELVRAALVHNRTKLKRNVAKRA